MCVGEAVEVSTIVIFVTFQ